MKTKQLLFLQILVLIGMLTLPFTYGTSLQYISIVFCAIGGLALGTLIGKTLK